jgi:DNA-directed DNA polymerase III PolC
MIHLHCHSHYSLLCGASSPRDLARRAAELELSALALTDLNAMHGMVDFQKACLEAGIRPIHGVELTDDRPEVPSGVAAHRFPGGRPPGAPPPAGPTAAGSATDPATDHLPLRLVPGSLAPGRRRAVLLARNELGFAALCRLTTLRQIQPDFNLACQLPPFLAAEGANVFCLTDSEELLAALDRAARAARGGHPDLMAATGGALRVLLTTAGGKVGPLLRRLRRLAGWAEAHRVPVIAGGDIYMARHQEAVRQRLLAAIRTRTTIHGVPPAACAPPGSHLRAPGEMRHLLAEFPTACPETEAVAEECRFRHRLGQWRYPVFPLPPGETSESYLWKLCFDGLQRRYRRVTSEAMGRLQAEIAAVEKLGFAGYFLIVWDIVRFAAAQSMPSLGRGSAANSLISYLLGITHVDPLAHDLYFQRFLNPERVSPPDIDLDFGWKDRDAVLDYVYEKYGRDHTAMICNLNRFSARSAFREVAKAHGHAESELGRISKRLPHHALEEDPEEAVARIPEAATLPVQQEPYRSLLLAAQELDRFPRHLGIHAGGVVIGQEPLTELFPLQWARKGILVTQVDMYAIEDLGLVKIDLLAQRGLSVVADSARAVQEHHGVPVDLTFLPADDPGTRRLLREGETLGCFYIESPGMRALLRKLKADTFPVVVAASSVIRPGPSDSGMTRSFVLRHLGEEKPVLLHPGLKFLQETYGVMIYQEDVMRTLSAVAGMSLAEADLMRRAMSFKGDPADFLALKDRFLEGARATGATDLVGEEAIDEIWRQVSSFAGYAFCKAHSASYAVLSFQAAWLKAHYPAEFMAAVLSNGGGYYSTSAYLEEARRLGLEIRLPDVNHSEAEYTGRDGWIRIGLQQIHGLSRRSLDELLAARERDGRFTSLGDLLERVPSLSEPELENLIRCGACDGFELTRPELLWRHALLRKEQRGGGHGTARRERGNGRRGGRGGGGSSAGGGGRGSAGGNGGSPALPQIRAAGQTRAAGRDGARASGGAPMLFPLGRGGSAVALVPSIPDYSPQEKLRQEMEVLHLTATRHPLAALREYLQRRGAVPATDLQGWTGRRVKVAGLIVTTKTAQVRRTGELMKFVTIEDETGLCEVTLFPRVYGRYGHLLVTGGPYLVSGLVENDHGAISLTAERVEVV